MNPRWLRHERPDAGVQGRTQGRKATQSPGMQDKEREQAAQILLGICQEVVNGASAIEGAILKYQECLHRALMLQSGEGEAGVRMSCIAPLEYGSGYVTDGNAMGAVWPGRGQAAPRDYR